MQVFHQSHEIILKSKHIRLLNVYNASRKVKDVNEYRYISLKKVVVKKRAVNLATLPSTAGAANITFPEHIYRHKNGLSPIFYLKNGIRELKLKC